ncbi:AAA family ATPase [Sulfitobacter sp. TB366]|uniref:AAA family ATPase n=1 Tax=Sulfitobacter sp. TB366 TaxID=3368580 RepID=UPI003745DDC6
MGKIKTISESEINSLRAIKRLLTSYLENTAHESKPLAIAVFGPPGSGKSFTVKSIFKTLSGFAETLTQDSFIECNLSGYRDPENLSSVFDAARDMRLSGKIPVIFFDEFDCDLSGSKFFWLKQFLSPIQDGTFTSSFGSHPIGKSIFVFAGGICSTFSKFQSELEKSYNAGEKPSHKGRDFLSRLKGHIDVDGITPMDDNDLPVDTAPENYFNSADFRRYTFRRSIILRELLKEHAGTVFSGNDEARISDSVIRAFLSEPGYKHGVRSMEAIIRMSSIDRRFSAECLPRKAQLLMHASDRFCTATPGSH